MTFWNMNSELKESDEQTQPVLIMIEENMIKNGYNLCPSLKLRYKSFKKKKAEEIKSSDSPNSQKC